MGKLFGLLNIFDMKFLYLINTRIKSNKLDKLLPLLTNIGSAAFTLIFTSTLVLFGRSRVKIAGIESVFALITSSIFVIFLKGRFTRPRPYWVIDNVNSFNMNLKDYSFPSGHTTAAFSLATVLSYNFPHFILLFMSIALIVGLSRIYLAVHFPTDVIMGIIIGVSFGLFNSSMIHPYFIYRFLELKF